MGGSGSGRWRLGSTSTTAERRTLDVRTLMREGFLEEGKISVWEWNRYDGSRYGTVVVKALKGRVILCHHRQMPGGAWEVHDYLVGLDWTDCHLGGRRPWFHCPVRGCGRRAAILYSGSIFACRHCHKLSYESQSESAGDRPRRRAEAIRKRLGWKPGLINPCGGKPKGMHWKTYLRLREEYGCALGAAVAGLGEQVKRIAGRVGRVADEVQGTR